MNDNSSVFEQYRSLLFSIAYRMLGSVMEAEDIVQESYLRFAAADLDSVVSPKALLSTITTRLCIDRLRSAQARREQYVGPWLPEPLVTEELPEQMVGRYEEIAMAFLVLLESLSPVERAVYLLREVFDYDYDEIAAIVDKSATNCRQIHSRAAKYLRARRPRFESSRAAQERLIGSFMAAVRSGDLEGLTHVLAEDVQVASDGGGKVPAAINIVTGQHRVTRFLMGLFGRMTTTMSVDIQEVNGAPSLIVREGSRVFAVVHFAFAGQKIQAVQIVVNPDKLHHLQPAT
ncbi:MAG: RNA polymerase sigma-70 factor [Caldilineaceae bacterium]|nr:RNA polymerase sigma-70 factor [Caldilineaceae bacterium]